MEWLNETITHFKKGNWLYRVICFFMFKKKLTYKEYYLLVSYLNKDSMGEEEAKRKALIRVLKLYKDLHNGELPEGVEDDDDE